MAPGQRSRGDRFLYVFPELLDLIRETCAVKDCFSSEKRTDESFVESDGVIEDPYSSSLCCDLLESFVLLTTDVRFPEHSDFFETAQVC